MKSRDSAKKPSPAKGGRKTAARAPARDSSEPNPFAQWGERLSEAVLDANRRLVRIVDPEDPVDRANAQWAREMPDVEIEGADVLNRARRIVLESRGPIEANFRKYGLDTGEFDVLATLRRAGEPYALRPTELYLSLMISSGGLTARLDKLEAAGFIRRWPAEDDARSVIVELTPAGKKKIEAAFRDDMALENKMVERLSEHDRAELVRLLRKLAQAMRV